MNTPSSATRGAEQATGKLSAQQQQQQGLDDSYDSRYEFDCPQFTDFTLEDEMDENSEVTNEDGFFAVRSDSVVSRNNLPNEWIKNIEDKMGISNSNNSLFETIEEDTENQNSLNLRANQNTTPGHRKPEPFNPSTPLSEAPGEVVVDELTFDHPSTNKKTVLPFASSTPDVHARPSSPELLDEVEELDKMDEAQTDFLLDDQEDENIFDDQRIEPLPSTGSESCPDLLSPLGPPDFNGAALLAAAIQQQQGLHDQKLNEEEQEDQQDYHEDEEGNESNMGEFDDHEEDDYSEDHEAEQDYCEGHEVEQDSLVLTHMDHTPAQHGFAPEEDDIIEEDEEDEEDEVYAEDAAADEVDTSMNEGDFDSKTPAKSPAAASPFTANTPADEKDSPIAASSRSSNTITEAMGNLTITQEEQYDETMSALAKQSPSPAPSRPETDDTPTPSPSKQDEVEEETLVPKVMPATPDVEIARDASSQLEDHLQTLSPPQMAPPSESKLQEQRSSTPATGHAKSVAKSSAKKPTLGEVVEAQEQEEEEMLPASDTFANEEHAAPVTPAPEPHEMDHDEDGESDVEALGPNITTPASAAPVTPAADPEGWESSQLSASRIPRLYQRTSDRKEERGRSQTRRGPEDRSRSVRSAQSTQSVPKRSTGVPSYLRPTSSWASKQASDASSKVPTISTHGVPVPRKPSNAGRGSTPRSTGSAPVISHQPPVKVSRSKLTEPKTPRFATSTRPRREARPSSTTQELQQLQKEREEYKKMVERRQAELQRAASNTAAGVERRPLTKPETPAFKLSKRLGSKTAQVEEKVPEKRPTATGRGPVRPTRPQDFHFATDTRVASRNVGKENSEAQPYVSMAAQVHAFSHKTPARFRPGKKMELPEKKPMHLTEPVEPRFASDMRARATHVKSREELEEEEMKKYKPFKARPLPESVIHSNGEMGVPKVEKKAPVVPHGFNFRTDARASVRRTAVTESGAASVASAPHQQAPTARPRRNSLGSEGAQDPHKLTRAAPFKFRTDMRAATRPLSTPPSKTEEQSSFHARPMPDFSKPPAFPVIERRALSGPMPFNLESTRRHEIAMQRRAEELARQQEEEERARHFKARPITISVHEPEVMASEKPLTEPETPIALRRSIQRAQERDERLAREAADELARHKFKARNLPKSTYEQTFVPELPRRVCGVLDIKLSSDARAEERRLFDQRVAEHLRFKEEELKREEERKRAEEEAALREYRKTLVPKARPVPEYVRTGTVTHMPTPQRLTQPESPFLMTKSKYGPKQH